jgi:hypothetical protein
MRKYLNEKKIELSPTEKFLRVVIFLGLFGQFLLSFYSPIRNLPGLVIMGVISIAYYRSDERLESPLILSDKVQQIVGSDLNFRDKLLHLIPGIFISIITTRNFLYAFLEFSLGIEFQFKKIGGKPIFNHPIPLWIDLGMYVGMFILFFLTLFYENIIEQKIRLHLKKGSLNK